MNHNRNHNQNTDNNIGLAFGLNLGFAIFELFGGLWVNSIAVISDAFYDSSGGRLGDNFMGGFSTPFASHHT